MTLVDMMLQLLLLSSFLLMFTSLEGNYVMVLAESKPTASRRGSGGDNYVRFQPRQRIDRNGFVRGNGIKECLPRSFHPPPSAPSQYANYFTLGSDLCGSTGSSKP